MQFMQFVGALKKDLRKSLKPKPLQTNLTKQTPSSNTTQPEAPLVQKPTNAPVL